MLIPLLFVALSTNELQAEVYVSDTAQLFHIVDQLSNWSPYCHQQYRRHFQPTAEDDSVLDAHKQLRVKVGYGALDHAFYTPASLSDALSTLTADQRAIEARVFAHFEPKLRPFIDANRALLASAKERLRADDRLRAFTAETSRFFLGARANVPVYLIASIEGSNGGGYNGDRLTVEVSPSKDGVALASLVDTFCHEVWHAFASTQRARLEAAVKPYVLDVTTLSEGLAYAAAPGIYGSPPAEKLFDGLASGKHWRSDPFTRFNTLAIALLPSLKDALKNGETITSYLPRAMAVYRGLHLLGEAADDTKPRFFVFGASEHGKAIHAQGYDTWMRSLTPAALDELKPEMQATDVVVIVLTAGTAIPSEYRALFLDKWPDVESSMRTNESGTWSGTWNDRRVAAVWAKTNDALSPLVKALPKSFERKRAQMR